MNLEESQSISVYHNKKYKNELNFTFKGNILISLVIAVCDHYYHCNKTYGTFFPVSENFHILAQFICN